MRLEIIADDGDNRVTRIYARKGFIIHDFALDIDEDNALYASSVIDMQPIEKGPPYPCLAMMEKCFVKYIETKGHSGS